jgi:hypothetical protein
VDPSKRRVLTIVPGDLPIVCGFWSAFDEVGANLELGRREATLVAQLGQYLARPLRLNVVAADALYRRVLRGQFDDLEPVLRRFHDSPHGGAAVGQVAVERGKSRLARTLAWLLRLPAESSRSSVNLKVTVDERCEIWERTFDGHRLRTQQKEWQGQLVESTGLMSFAFELVAADGRLEFMPKGVWLCGVRIPAGLAPLATARVAPRGERWQIDMQLRLPGGELLLRYHGLMAPQQ